MVTIQVSARQVHELPVDGYVVFCPAQDSIFADKNVQTLERFYAPLKELIEKRKFSGKAGSSLIVAGAEGTRPVQIMLFGLGAHKRPVHERVETYRRAIGSMVRTIEATKINTVALHMPDEKWFDCDAFVLAKETAIIADMAAYHFDQYITNEDARPTRDIELTLCAPELLHDAMKLGIEQGQHIGFAVSQARHWCDMPASVVTPTHLAEHAERIAKAHNLGIKVFTEPEIIKMGMGGLAAVAKGSEQECRFVVMEYQCDVPNAPTIGIAGKGVTFDTGGISIKPSAGMETMKDDMAGAAAVISTMEAIAHLKPQVNVIGLAPLAENMPGGNATRPGDIVQFYNGKTAEVRNTDAEGRLILADALSYGVKHYQFDALVNLATLTGSCSHALGPFYCGLMTKHEELGHKVLAAGGRSGDRAWPLPFSDDYNPAVKSTVADLCNDSNATYRAGAITAGKFLQHFVGDVPWVHLDIAGTAFNVPDVSYYRPGATGFGVRLLVDLLMNWKQ